MVLLLWQQVIMFIFSAELSEDHHSVLLQERSRNLAHLTSSSSSSFINIFNVILSFLNGGWSCEAKLDSKEGEKGVDSKKTNARTKEKADRWR